MTQIICKLCNEPFYSNVGLQLHLKNGHKKGTDF